MKKSLFFLLFLITVSNSETLITFDDLTNNKSILLCVKSYEVLPNQINYIDSLNVSNSFSTFGFYNFKFDDSYLLNSNNNCYKDLTLYMGLNYQNFQFIMALFGLLLGNTILFIFGSSFTRR